MKRFLVIGLGQLGSLLAKALFEKGAEVIAVDRDMDLVEEIKESVTSAACLDSTDEAALESLSLSELDAAIIAIAEDIQASILTAALLKDLGVETIIARSSGPLHAKILTKIGVTRILSPELNVAEQLARSLVSPGLLEHIALPDGHTIFQVQAREEFFGKSLIELDFRRNFGLLVVGIHRKTTEVTESGEIRTDVSNISLPSATEAIMQGDVLILVGMHEDIERFLARS